ncbi:Inorganic pyrophosphatase [invertebrate metagenome]|uniref:inorganic diphosphatase n=1 Tax=invertebrate metagenome TaxID=1711999 RepID=A0A2H9T949_9ZZZZ
MSYASIPAGKQLPDDLYAIIEIPAQSSPIKYEVDKGMDALVVDRFMPAPMFYPANYGYISQTLADDGDPLDILVITPTPVVPGSVIRCRPVGMLNMSDESGQDEKIIAVPHDKTSALYKSIREYTDLPELLLQQIEHFFENYKTLEPGKWVKIDDWQGSDAARDTILKSVANYK